MLPLGTISTHWNTKCLLIYMTTKFHIVVFNQKFNHSINISLWIFIMRSKGVDKQIVTFLNTIIIQSMQIVETTFFITNRLKMCLMNTIPTWNNVINHKTTSQYGVIMYTNKLFTAPNVWCRIALDVLSKEILLCSTVWRYQYIESPKNPKRCNLAPLLLRVGKLDVTRRDATRLDSTGIVREKPIAQCHGCVIVFF